MLCNYAYYTQALQSSAGALNGVDNLPIEHFSKPWILHTNQLVASISLCRAPGLNPVSTSSQFAKQEVRARIAARNKQQQQRQLSQGVTNNNSSSGSMSTAQMHMNSSQVAKAAPNTLPPPSYSGAHHSYSNMGASFESAEIPQHILDDSKSFIHQSYTAA